MSKNRNKSAAADAVSEQPEKKQKVDDLLKSPAVAKAMKLVNGRTSYTEEEKKQVLGLYDAIIASNPGHNEVNEVCIMLV